MTKSSIHVVDNIWNFVGITACGFKDDTGIYGGVYYQKHINKDKKLISARWETNILHEGDLFRIVVWNKYDAEEGKGLADVCAKLVSPGKEFSCTAKKGDFQKKVFVKGVPVMKKGKQVEKPFSNYVVTGNIMFGPDSEERVKFEIDNFIENFDGRPTFDMRPPNWNWAKGMKSTNESYFGTTDRWQDRNNHDLWKAIIKARMGHIHDGKSTFGYAKVV